MGRLFSSQVRQAFPPPPVLPYPGAPMPGQSLNLRAIDSAMVIPAVWACVSLLANVISTLPLKTYRRNGTINVRVEDPPLIKQPEPNCTQSEWVHSVMVSELLRGNAYGLVTEFDRHGYPLSIVILNPDEVQGRQDRVTGRVEYRLGAESKVHSRFGSDGPNPDVWHLPGMKMPGVPFGLSPIQYAAAALGIDVNSRDFANDFFDGSSIPKAILESDQEIDQNQATTIKDRLMASMRKREPMVLGAGLKFNQLSIRPEEAQFISTQQFSVAQIARFFNVPPEMIGGEAGKSMTYQNREQRSLDFLTYCVSFWLRRIEDSMFNLLPGKVFTEFDVSALLRTDAETAAAVHIQQIAAKLRTPSEIRTEDMNLPVMTQEQKNEVDLVPLVVNVIGGSKLGVKVNTSIEQQMSPNVPNYIDDGPPSKSKA